MVRERWTVNLTHHSLRPQLEDLNGEEIAKLAVEVTAEARRRALVLGENNESAANDLVHELQDRAEGFEARIVKREWNAQHAERMSLAWAARADALMKERPDVPTVPTDPGKLLDDVIRAADNWLRAGNQLPYGIVGPIREAALARKTPLGPRGETAEEAWRRERDQRRIRRQVAPTYDAPEDDETPDPGPPEGVDESGAGFRG